MNLVHHCCENLAENDDEGFSENLDERGEDEMEEDGFCDEKSLEVSAEGRRKEMSKPVFMIEYQLTSRSHQEMRHEDLINLFNKYWQYLIFINQKESILQKQALAQSKDTAEIVTSKIFASSGGGGPATAP